MFRVLLYERNISWKIFFFKKNQIPLGFVIQYIVKLCTSAKLHRALTSFLGHYLSARKLCALFD